MEIKKKKEQMKCPICGRFIRKELAEKYDELLKEKDGLDAGVQILRDTCRKRDEELNKLLSEQDALRSDYELLSEKYEGLKRRGFFARLFNKG